MVTKKRLARSNPEARREHIVDVAREAFMREGYAGTSMSMVAVLLGGSKATLYKYFPSKEMLFEAVMHHSCRGVAAEIASNSLKPDNPLDLLVEVGLQSLTVMLTPEALLISRLVHAEGARHPEIARIFFSNGVDHVNQALAERLAHFHATGAIRCTDPLLTASQFMGMVRADWLMRAISGVEISLDEAAMRSHVMHAAALLIDGMTPLRPAQLLT